MSTHAVTAIGRVRAVNVGRVAALTHAEGVVDSAIAKAPATGPVAVATLGLAGDEQGDTVNHGGPDRALCAFAAEHVPAVEAHLGHPLPPAAFGENLTVEGLLEDGVCIGDVLRAGTALVQVSTPRTPCYKLAARNGEPRLAAWVQRAGCTGFYLRVLEEGEVAAGDRVEVVERRHPALTVAEANRVRHIDRDDRAAARALLVPELGADWREAFERRLAGA
ncbi:MAG: MOSC domain-containing protein [Solirubrobacterales bacterium]|nr:MOSC domain-containing protein [Solirubrobacterales bacterium]